jgi:hypothetical protein
VFFTYRQNNSFGKFDADDKVAVYVIIEADSAKEADQRAQDWAGIYFNGCDQGIDCPCCGDRWSEAWDDNEGTEEPTIYGEPAQEYLGTGTAFICTGDDQRYALVYYAKDEGKPTRIG